MNSCEATLNDPDTVFGILLADSFILSNSDSNSDAGLTFNPFARVFSTFTTACLGFSNF